MFASDVDFVDARRCWIRFWVDRCQMRPYCGRRKRGIMVEVADDMVCIFVSLFAPSYVATAMELLESIFGVWCFAGM